MTDETVGVVIGTYGDRAEWTPMVQRASASVEAQTHPADTVVWEHADTLQNARNWGAGKARDCDWLIFLDADDELDPGYIEAMLVGNHGTIRRPSTIGIYADGTEDEDAVMIPEKPLDMANFIIIGALCRAEMFFEVGGFADLPCLEDWHLWRRMVAEGASIVAVPDAIYRVHVNLGGRNQGDPALHGRTYAAIRAGLV